MPMSKILCGAESIIKTPPLRSSATLITLTPELAVIPTSITITTQGGSDGASLSVKVTCRCMGQTEDSAPLITCKLFPDAPPPKH